MDDTRLYGGIEAGGTKFICAVATAPEAIIEQVTIPTASPDETFANVIDFFKRYPTLSSVGVASFGPLDLQTGTITTTPKKGWQNVALKQTISSKLGISVAIDTDVNGAAVAEQRYGAGKGVANLTYITVGTGIGAGSIIDGKLLKGTSHIEAGHVLIPRLLNDTASSACPFHENCFEGLASGTALRLRADKPVEELTSSDLWEQEATYLAYGLANIILTTAPDRIIIGGGVMGHKGLLESIRIKLGEAIGGYIPLPDMATYITPPALGSLSGVTGALLLATSATT